MTCALIVVDVQQGFDDAVWGPRNNPECDANIAALVDAWRRAELPVVFVRHDSASPGSPLAPGTPGNQLKPFLQGVKPDLLISKSVNSCFYGTPNLQAWLDDRQILAVAICGITTNHCCETTARMAGNLGYEVSFVLDATHTFDREAPDGSVIPADQIARVTAANLHEEFATIVSTAEITAGVGTSG